MKSTLFYSIIIGLLGLLFFGELKAQTPTDTQKASSLSVELSVGSNIGSKATATGKPPVVFTSPELQIKQVQNSNNNTALTKNKRVVFTSPELQQKRNNR